MLDLEETVFRFDPQTQVLWNGGKDPIGLVIKVSKLGVVPATCNPSTAVGEGEAEVGGWRKEKQPDLFSEREGESTPLGCRATFVGQRSEKILAKLFSAGTPQADLGTRRPRHSQSVVSEVIGVVLHE